MLVVKMTIMFLILSAAPAIAEPWLASRFSQNCVGCHSPGRKNLEMKDRRCSLSCQGCHLNPNGGGLRNRYGKWNENNWLKSFTSSYFKQKETASPFDKQIYLRGTLERESGYVENEEPYDRNHNKNYLSTAKSRAEFEGSIAKEDPYFEKQQDKVIVGSDLRIMNLKDLTNDFNRTFLMSADIGLSYKPTEASFQIVHESRLLGQFTGDPLDRQLSQWETRSFYGLFDDLPYNSFVMGGYYRPLFGNDHPDHTRLSRKIIASTLTGNSRNSYKIKYRAFGVGTAPNVPYLNLHLIKNQIDEASPLNGTEGLVVNTGLRFVTLGASINYTYWNQKTPMETSRDTRVLMHNLYLTTTLGLNRFHLGLEAISAQVERGDDFYRTAVLTLESYIRVWRQAYLSLEYSQANAAESLEEGYSKQAKGGLKWFIMPGLELQGTYTIDRNEKNQTETERRFVSTQIHLYH